MEGICLKQKIATQTFILKKADRSKYVFVEKNLI